MSQNIGLQLWSVRNELNSSINDTIHHIDKLGFSQVEGTDLRQLSHLQPYLKDKGIKVNSCFLLSTQVTQNWAVYNIYNPAPIFPVYKKSLEHEFTLACEQDLKQVVIGYLFPEERADFSLFQHRVDEINSACELANSLGLTLAYHNHGFEFELNQKGLTAYDYLVKNSDSLVFELDIMWAHAAKQNPLKWIDMLENRLSSLHLKDTTLTNLPHYNDQTLSPESFCALGQGEVNVKGAVAAANKIATCKQVYVEQDYSNDIYQDLSDSLAFYKALSA